MGGRGAAFRGAGGVTRRRSLLAAPALLAAAAARAQAAYPNRPIRIICGFPPAGTTDIAARLIAERLQAKLGQPVTVENRPGATGNIGAEAAARAEPDGYTLHATNVGTGAINYALFGARMPVKPEDFAAVGLLMRVPNLVVVHPSVPVQDIAGLIALAKAQPGRLNYGSAGSGGSPHMCMELFKLQSGTQITHVPFRGAGPMLIELVAGRLEVGCDNLPSIIGHVRDGRLRPLAVTSTHRSPVLPQVPTLQETGLTGFDATSWFAVQAPARIPPPILAQLGQAVDEITQEPLYRSRIAELGADPPNLTPAGGTTPETFAAFTRTEIAKWAEVVRGSGIALE